MKKNIVIDINCDLGEGSTRADADNDARLMPYLSSCNIACGGHAGNLETIEYAINDAIKNELKIGAHPGYSDPENFGRKSLLLSEEAVIGSLQEQLEKFLTIAEKCNAKLNHIKLHGALYNDVEKDVSLASAVAVYLKKSFPDIEVYGLAQGVFSKVCKEIELSYVPEGFMDRRYTLDGKLAPRSESNAVITQVSVILEQALALAKQKPIKSVSGELISPVVKTICLHGDNENALTIAKQLHELLLENEIVVA